MQLRSIRRWPGVLPSLIFKTALLSIEAYMHEQQNARSRALAASLSASSVPSMDTGSSQTMYKKDDIDAGAILRCLDR